MNSSIIVRLRWSWSSFIKCLSVDNALCDYTLHHIRVRNLTKSIRLIADGPEARGGSMTLELWLEVL